MGLDGVLKQALDFAHIMVITLTQIGDVLSNIPVPYKNKVSVDYNKKTFQEAYNSFLVAMKEAGPLLPSPLPKELEGLKRYYTKSGEFSDYAFTFNGRIGKYFHFLCSNESFYTIRKEGKEHNVIVPVQFYGRKAVLLINVQDKAQLESFLIETNYFRTHLQAIINALVRALSRDTTQENIAVWLYKKSQETKKKEVFAAFDEHNVQQSHQEGSNEEHAEFLLLARTPPEKRGEVMYCSAPPCCAKMHCLMISGKVLNKPVLWEVRIPAAFQQRFDPKEIFNRLRYGGEGWVRRMDEKLTQWDLSSGESFTVNVKRTSVTKQGVELVSYQGPQKSFLSVVRAEYQYLDAYYSPSLLTNTYHKWLEQHPYFHGARNIFVRAALCYSGCIVSIAHAGIKRVEAYLVQVTNPVATYNLLEYARKHKVQVDFVNYVT